AVMGSVLAASMTQLLTDRQADIIAEVQKLGAEGARIADELASGALPATRDLPEGIALIIEQVSAESISHAFIVGVPIALLSLIAICFLPNNPLTRQTTTERLRAEKAAAGEAAGQQEEHPMLSSVSDVSLAATGGIALPELERGRRGEDEPR